MNSSDQKIVAWISSQRPQLEKVRNTLLRRADCQSLLGKLNEVLSFPPGMILNPYQEQLVRQMKAELQQFIIQKQNNARQNEIKSSASLQQSSMNQSFGSTAASSSPSMLSQEPSSSSLTTVSVASKVATITTPPFSVIKFHQNILKLHKCCLDLSDRNTYIIKLISSNISRIKGTSYYV